MKKIISLVLAFAMVLCVCGCNSDDGNASSEPIETIYEEVVIDETGNSIDTETNSQETTVSDDTPTDDQTSDESKNEVSSQTAVVIDYDSVVEVDICDDVIRSYLSQTQADKQFYWLNTFSGTSTKYDYQTLSLYWKMSGGPYTLYISENADFSNAQVIVTSSVSIKGTILVPGKTYYWKVLGPNSSDPLGGGRIKVKDAPVRWIQIDGTGNVRDMGGWKTESGKTVKYGMLYRGQNIDNISDTGIATIKQLGLKTEFDLRYERQKFQKTGTGMNYVFLDTYAQYDRIFWQDYEDEVKANYKRIFELLSDESNYPFYTHCSAGADRTGTFAFLTNGLLGVSYEDLTRDFELTSFSSSGKRWRGNGTGNTFLEGDDEMNVSGNYVAWGKLYKNMMHYGSKNGCATLSQSIEHYLINYIGVPKSQIDSFKNIMLK